MDISLQPTETWTPDDHSWLGSSDGTKYPQGVTLDVSTFTSGTHYPAGYIPSGVVLGRITATGLYGPYDNTANDGREVAAGFLYTARRVRSGGPDVGAALHWRGVVVAANLPTGHGLDSNARTDLAAKFWIQ